MASSLPTTTAMGRWMQPLFWGLDELSDFNYKNVVNDPASDYFFLGARRRLRAPREGGAVRDVPPTLLALARVIG
jgi:hypothetical protein